MIHHPHVRLNNPRDSVSAQLVTLPTLRTFRRYYKQMAEIEPDTRAMAACFYWTEPDGTFTVNLMFHRAIPTEDRLKLAVHEAHHAAQFLWRHLRRRRLFKGLDADEYLAYTVSALVPLAMHMFKGKQPGGRMLNEAMHTMSLGTPR